MSHYYTQNESSLLKDVGCKEKEWNHVGSNRKYHWVGKGELLEEGVCIDTSYRKISVPEKGTTKVYTTIEYQKVRDVNDKKQTLFVDMILTLQWFDPNIKTKFSEEDDRNDGITLSSDAVQKIWTPDLYIWNRTSVKERQEWASLVKARVLKSHATYDINNAKQHNQTISKTLVEMKYEIKTEVFCKFDYAKYPMDEQCCNVTISSGSNEAIFVLNVKNNAHHSSSRYKAVNLKMSVDFFDENVTHGGNKIGIQISMDRQLEAYLMKYYIPCMAVVIVSEIGFVIPITAIPGRVGLLVTQFLTLVNLFIYQMVRNFRKIQRQ